MIPLQAVFCRTTVDVRLFASTICQVSAVLLSMPDAELINVVKEAEYLEQPQDNNYYDDAIQDGFDLTLHGYVSVHQIEQQADYT